MSSKMFKLIFFASFNLKSLETTSVGKGAEALRPDQLRTSTGGLTMIFDMSLRRFSSVVHCVFVVTTS